MVELIERLRAHSFSPVMQMPQAPVVLDLRAPAPASDAVWTVGRYDEDRCIYTAALFEGRRTLHVGIDLGGPVGTPVLAPCPGQVEHAGHNPAPGDYGHVLVVRLDWGGPPLFMLLGHLSAASPRASPAGRTFAEGDVLGWLGAADENGGWPPHAHVQLAWERPATHDLPGAVDPAERAEALRRYPDPRLVLGPIY